MPQTFQDRADLLGELQAENSVFVRSEMPGVIEAILFEEGSEVEAGRRALPAARRRAERAPARGRSGTAISRRRISTAPSSWCASTRPPPRSSTRRPRSWRSRRRASSCGASSSSARASARPSTAWSARGWSRPASASGRRPARADRRGRPAPARLRAPRDGVPFARIGAEIRSTCGRFPAPLPRRGLLRLADARLRPTRRIMLKAWVPNPDRTAAPGLFAHVEASSASARALLVPESALVYDARGHLRLAGRRGRRRRARAGRDRRCASRARRGDARALRRAIAIVTAGTHKVTAGARCGAAPAEDAPAAGRAPPQRRGRLMRLSEVCIERPVLATVMSLVIVLFGAIALLAAPEPRAPGRRSADRVA